MADPALTTIFYHRGCADGLAAAWCFWRISKEYQFIYIAPDEKSITTIPIRKNLIFVDCSYKPALTAKLLETHTVTIYDHHKSALDVMGLPVSVSSIVDMTRSAAQIVWDLLNDSPRPEFIEYIADRDLYTWKLDSSREISKAMFEFGYLRNFESLQLLSSEFNKEFLAKAGAKMLPNHQQRLNDIANTAVKVKLVGTDLTAYLVSCSHDVASEVCEILYNRKDTDFAVAIRYDFKKNEWWLSLRASRDSDIDLDTIAKKYIVADGGGHPKASGATLKGIETLRQIFK